MEKLKAKWEEEMRAQLLENDKEIAEMKKSYEEKLRQQKKDVGVSREFDVWFLWILEKNFQLSERKFMLKVMN